MEIAILQQPFGPEVTRAEINSAPDLAAALAGVQGNLGSLAIILSSGDRRQVHSGDDPAHGWRPIRVRCWALHIDPAQAVWAWAACIAEAGRGGETRGEFAPPRYRTERDAWLDGWQTNMPTTDYRGWMIIPEYRRDEFRAQIRERSGSVIAGRHGFRTIRAPRLPKTQPVIVDSTMTKFVARHRLNRLIRRQEWEAFLDAARRRIDVRLDCSADADVVEDLE